MSLALRCLPWSGRAARAALPTDATLTCRGVHEWSCPDGHRLSLTFAEYIMWKYLPAFVSALTLAVCAGCTPVRNVGNAVIDCLAADRAGIDAVLAGLGTRTRPDGTRDWSAIEADALAAGVVIGGCALAELVESILPPASHAAASSDDAAARQTFEHFRSTRAGNATFKTRLGTL